MTLTLQQFFLILLARRKTILLSLLSVVGATVAASLILPARYTATAAVVVDVKSPDPIMGAVLPALSMPGYMATQIDIIQSDRVAQRVVKMLKLDQNPAAIEQWKEDTDGRGTVVDWLSTQLRRKLKVMPSRESNVVNIAFNGATPKFAAAVANAFSQAYIDTTVDLKVVPAKQFATFFDERTKALRDKLERAQTRLSEYQRKHGIVSTDERLDVENARLAELSTQMVVIQGEKSASQSREHLASGNSNTLADVLQNPLIQSLKADVARQDAKFRQLSSQLGKNHPQFKQETAQLNALRERLDSEVAKVTEGVATANRVNTQRLSEVRSALDAQKRKVLALKEGRDELAVLQREVEAAQRNYDLITDRLGQSSLESQSQQTNVVVLTPASEPIEPSFPKPLLNFILSVFLGTILGVGMGLLLEILDRRVRSSEDLVASLGLPVLGVIEAGNTRRSRRVGRLALPKANPALPAS